MAQRSRPGRAGDPRVLGAVAAALLLAALVLAALVVTGRVLSADRPSPAAPPPASSGPGTRPPLRLGGTVECPPGWPVLAAADHISYPPGHPGQPPRVAAAACYRTAAQAADAGYAPAPLPPGAVEVGGVYLAPTGTAFRAGCRRPPTGSASRSPAPGCCPACRLAPRHRGCAASRAPAGVGSCCSSGWSASRSRSTTSASPAPRSRPAPY